LCSRKLITKNLTVEDNNNHINDTQIFGQIVPGKIPEENQCNRFGDFIIQQKNIEIFLQKIDFHKILSQTSAKFLQDEVQPFSQPLEPLCFNKTQHKPLRESYDPCVRRAPYVTL
jgi:hypothetical protein